MNWIFRILRSPRTLLWWLSDHLFTPFYLKIQGIKIGRKTLFFGIPRITTIIEGQIRIGNGVKLFSRPRSNPLQVQFPCSFTVLKPEARIEIGDFSGLTGTVICCQSSVIIGKRVNIGANCTIIDTDFHPLLPEKRNIHSTDGAVNMPIIIEDDVFIGTQAIILKGTRLAKGCVVGAGAVVAGKYPERSVLAGNPATVIKTLPL
jgi:acetyltransferase-like isoleucine patch superfamily enzyme